MSTINTNISSLIAQNVLAKNQASLSTSLERLSTGLQINTGADNPAGLIASESLKSQNAALTSAIGNAQRASSITGIADGGLAQIQSLLTQVQSLVATNANSSGLSTDEKNANQLQVDSILQTINRIAATTSFAGANLLNGTYDFQITGKNAAVAGYEVDAAKITTGGTVGVNTLIANSAQHGTLFLSFATSTLNTAGAAFTFDLAGAQGVHSFSFASSTKLSAIASSIDAFTSVTGTSAVASGRYIRLKSTGFGSSQFVSFKLDAATTQAGGVVLASAKGENTKFAAAGTLFTALNNTVIGKGKDVGAYINGVKASGNGLIASVNTDALALSITFTSGAAGAQKIGALAGGAFTVSGGGATFNIGSGVNLNNQVSLGIANVATTNLGTSTVGYLSQLGTGQTYNLVTGDMTKAQNIVNAAISQISNLRGRIGAFQNFTLGSTINNLNVALENTTAAQSAITDTNFATETANLTRSQVLVTAATQVLGIANNNGNTVLKLLGA